MLRLPALFATGLVLLSPGMALAQRQVVKLTADDAAASDTFGFSVSISGDLAIVGAERDDDAAVDCGSAYVFARNQGGPDNWGQLARLTAADAADVDLFGFSVSISDGFAIVGAPFADNETVDSGSAYLFDLCATDINGDGVIDVADLIELLPCFGQPSDPPCHAADTNGDGTVNVLDLIKLLLALGTACS
ncbi:MAG: dockerin type I domain-containing protein [Planctomycetota bacterium]|jgi:hypothetical protein